MKDLDEAALDYVNSTWITFPEEAVKKAFKAGVEFAQQWISVEEQLPEHRQDLLEDTPLRKKINGHAGFVKTKQVLVKFRDGTFDVGRRCKCRTDDYYFWDCLESFEKNNHRNIIEWRPIELK